MATISLDLFYLTYVNFNRPFIPERYSTGRDYLNDYFSSGNYRQIDTMELINLNRGRVIDFPQQYGTALQFDIDTFVNNQIGAVLVENDYKYRKLYSTININYDVLTNYNVKVTEKITDEYGEKVESIDSGERKKTDAVGESVTTNVIGESNSTTKDDTTTFDTETYLPDSQTTTVDSERTNTSTNTPRTDVTTEAATNDLRTNSEYTDVHTKEYEEIGDKSVRAMADILQQERKLAYINLIEIIFDDIINAICKWGI